MAALYVESVSGRRAGRYLPASHHCGPPGADRLMLRQSVRKREPCSFHKASWICQLTTRIGHSRVSRRDPESGQAANAQKRTSQHRNREAS